MNVSILAVRPFLEVAAACGVSREEFLMRAGIASDRLDDPNGALEIPELDRIQELAIALTGDPALGLHMGEHARAPAYDVVGHLPSHTATLRETIEALIRFSRIHSDVSAKLEERGDRALVAFQFPGLPDAPATRFRAELSVTGFTRVLQDFGGEDALPRAVHFAHAPPLHRDEYARLFRGREHFSQPSTSIHFVREILSNGALHGSPRLKAILEGEAERMLERLDRKPTYAQRLRDWLGAREAAEIPTMDDAAHYLGLSARSLRRRLVEERASYPRLVEAARIARAKRLIEDVDRSVYQVAYDLGFSDPSAFHRAFRRWTGMTPMQYRGKLDER
jgi:AraC-like DNA-binding protein